MLHWEQSLAIAVGQSEEEHIRSSACAIRSFPSRRNTCARSWCSMHIVAESTLVAAGSDARAATGSDSLELWSSSLSSARGGSSKMDGDSPTAAARAPLALSKIVHTNRVRNNLKVREEIKSNARDPSIGFLAAKDATGHRETQRIMRTTLEKVLEWPSCSS